MFFKVLCSSLSLYPWAFWGFLSTLTMLSDLKTFINHRNCWKWVHSRNRNHSGHFRENLMQEMSWEWSGKAAQNQAETGDCYQSQGSTTVMEVETCSNLYSGSCSSRGNAVAAKEGRKRRQREEHPRISFPSPLCSPAHASHWPNPKQDGWGGGLLVSVLTMIQSQAKLKKRSEAHRQISCTVYAISPVCQFRKLRLRVEISSQSYIYNYCLILFPNFNTAQLIPLPIIFHCPAIQYNPRHLSLFLTLTMNTDC